MPTSLQSTLNDLAASFANNVLAAIRGASLDELIAPNGQVRPNGRATAARTAPAAAPAPGRAARSSGRLPRRSPEDIAAVLGQVVSLVKKHKEGLRAEQIRAELGLQPKEMPRILKEGLERKALKSKGQKRATTYFAT
ncbi:MAG: hypothetical protein JOZ69_20090 [Myxococcales bacterium]|nr:hypothetical protein [Myxococcales bacterium]